MATKERNGFIFEIDFLRAICVLMVVVYHAFPSILPGGFIGVDVFFVISGFVISRSYLMPLIKGEATLRDFYVARFRRLAPAMSVVFLITVVCSIFIIQPDRLLPFANSLAAQTFYLQNFVFWIEGDYFSGALTKPLLHTWSLAVEEQFYIFWALAIIFFRRYPKAVVISIVILGFISFGFGFFLESRSPKTVFYMLPTRMWEFFLGILGYYAVRNFGDIKKFPIVVLSYFAISIIIFSGFIFDEKSQFPGVQSIIACGAAAVALFCFDRCSGLIPGLQIRSLVYIGKVSYGFYLWHWPPLALFFLSTGRVANPLEALLMMLLAFCGACISFHLIENPIRQKKFFSSSARMLFMMFASSGVMLLMAIFIIRTDGMLFMYPKEVQLYFSAPQERGGFRCGQIYVLMNPKSEFCSLNETARKEGGGVLILGDSHADVLKELLGKIGREMNLPVYLSVRNCDIGRYGTYKFCSDDVLNRIVSQSSKNGITDIVAISYWETDKFDGRSLRKDLSILVKAGLRVHIMEVVPNDDTYNPVNRARLALSGSTLQVDGITLKEYLHKTTIERDIFKSAVDFYPDSISIISPVNYFCVKEGCAWQYGGVPYYLDSNHLTFAGGEVLRPMFVRLFESISGSVAKNNSRAEF